MYIDFDYYSNNGGTVTDESAFNLLAFEACNYIDYYTFGRLNDFDEIPETVQRCAVILVNNLSTIENSVALDDGKRVSAVSNSGISVSYANTTQASLVADKDASVSSIIELCLSSVRTDKGLQITYRGV